MKMDEEISALVKELAANLSLIPGAQNTRQIPIHQNLEVIKETFLGCKERLLLPFSPQEQKLIESYCEGNVTKQIARELDISYETTLYHRRHIRKKLNCLTSAQCLIEIGALRFIHLVATS